MYTRRSRSIILSVLITVFLLIPVALAAEQPTAVVRCKPRNAVGLVGQTIPVRVRVRNVANLYAVDLRGTYDATVADGTLNISHRLLSADFIARQQLSGGNLWYAATQLAPTKPVTGTGTLLNLRWQAAQAGTFTLDLTHADLRTVDGTAIDATLQDCRVRFRGNLQAAVDSVEEEEEEAVVVPNGEHDDELDIDKNVTFIGAGSSTGNMPTFTRPTLLNIIGRRVTMKGFTFANWRPTFSGSGGSLIAFGNNIYNYQPFSGSGTVDLRHNYWGASQRSALQVRPATLSKSDWNHRLGAPVVSFLDGELEVQLLNARVSGENGLLAIVDHGRPTVPDDAPFGATTTGQLADLCSNFYDIFVRDGSGTYQVELTADDDVRCLTTIANKRIYYIPDIDQCATGACWQPFPPERIVADGQKATLVGLNSAELSGTPFVIGDPGATIGGAVPTVEIPDVSVDEGAGTAIITVTLTVGSAETIMLDYQTGDNSRQLGDINATAGLDYVAQADTLVFAPGDLQKRIEIILLEDPLYEWNNEQFHLNFQELPNAFLPNSQINVTIIDNDYGTILPFVLNQARFR